MARRAVKSKDDWAWLKVSFQCIIEQFIEFVIYLEFERFDKGLVRSDVSSFIGYMQIIPLVHFQIVKSNSRMLYVDATDSSSHNDFSHYESSLIPNELLNVPNSVSSLSCLHA